MPILNIAATWPLFAADSHNSAAVALPTISVTTLPESCFLIESIMHASSFVAFAQPLAAYSPNQSRLKTKMHQSRTHRIADELHC